MQCRYASHRVYILTSLLCSAIMASLLPSAYAQQIVPPFRPDLIGRATTGTATITVAGRTARPPIEEATFVLRADTEECVPRLFRACQFTVELLHIRVGAFNIESVRVQAADIRNQGPISITGPSIPARTPFDVELRVARDQDNFLVTMFESRDAAIAATPEGTGTIVLIGTLVGAVDGRQLTARLNIIAAPLVNRPPIARASSHQVFDSPLGEATCAATVVLDATATTDPDGNLSSLRWFDGNGTFVGEGLTIEVPVQTSGELLFRLIAVDDLGGAATAETRVAVIPPAGECRLASDNSIQAANSPAGSFEPLVKIVSFTLPGPAEVFIRYDLGQSHGCCADHVVGALRILFFDTEVLSDRIPFFNYGVPPFFLEDFDYFFPPDVVMGLTPPVSQLDPTRVGPPLQNYKRVDRVSLGNLPAGSYTVGLQVGDAGWNSIFEIYTLQ